MAWNGSNSTSTGSGKRSAANGSVHSPSRKASLSRGIFAGLLVVIIGGASVWWFVGNGQVDVHPAKESNEKHGIILEVKPQIATNKVIKFTNPLDETPEERLAYFEKRYGTNIPENLKTTVYFLKHPPTQTFRPPPRREDIFQHHSERVIAAVLLMQPGAFVMQRVSYDERFDENFKKSLEEPTLFSKDDTPEERELKEAVNEVKAELAERMRNGEKPSEIMTQAMDDAYELGKYKEELESLLRTIRDDPTKSDEDYEDFVAAANKMLKDKGSDELHTKTVISRQARLRHLARQRDEQEKANKQEENK